MFRIISIALIAIVSSLCHSGGGEVTEDYYWNRFYNPYSYLHIEETLSKKTVRNIIQAIEPEDFYRHDSSSGQWDQDVSLNEQLNALFIKTNRHIRIGSEEDYRETNFILIDPSSNTANTVGWSDCQSEGALRGIFDMTQAAMESNQLGDNDIQILLTNRFNLVKVCRTDRFDIKDFTANLNNTDWVNYLKGLKYYYTKNYDSAINEFQSLQHSSISYLNNIAHYMMGRFYLQSAQKNWHGWGDKSEIAHSKLEQAKSHFQYHINQNGRYKDSAKGLLRRIEYLKGNLNAYSSLYHSALADTLDKPSYERQLIEVTQLLNESLATDEYSNILGLLSRQASAFKENDQLFGLNRLVQFETGRTAFFSGNSDLAFTLLLESNLASAYPYLVNIAKSDRTRLEQVYNNYFKGNTLHMYAQTLNYEEKGLDAVFNSPNREFVSKAARSICSIETLERISSQYANIEHAFEIRAALYDRLIQSEEFTKLNTLFDNNLNDLGAYDAIRTAVRQLSDQTSVGKAYLNMGYFIDTKISPPDYSGVENFLHGLEPNVFCKQDTKRNDRNASYFYHLSIMQFSDSDTSVDEAKALHYMIQCDRRGQKGCWGERAEEAASSKVLFERLHRKYAHSKWAKKTPYYYD